MGKKLETEWNVVAYDAAPAEWNLPMASPWKDPINWPAGLIWGYTPLQELTPLWHDDVVEGDTATFWWHLEGGGSGSVSGRDVVVIRDGVIVSQVVHLDASDF